MRNLQFRAYHPTDLEEIVQLWIDCGLVVAHNNPLQDIERKCKVNPEWFLVGELEEELIASCMAGYEGHRGWINYLAVSPRYQRRGYATEMMEEAERLLAAAGSPKISLLIRPTNRGVIDFYKSIGFTVDEVVCMGKRLEPDEPYQGAE